MINDADIEMMELTAAANAAHAVIDETATELTGDVIDDIAHEAARHAWYGESLFEGVTYGIEDRSLKVTSYDRGCIESAAMRKLAKWEEREANGEYVKV